MDYNEILKLLQDDSQQYHSSDTSVNSKSLPAIYGKLKKQGIVITDALDYGCGKYFDEYHLDNVKGFDKYSYKKYENLNHHYKQGICSNVLNVIKEPEERKKVLNILHSICDIVYITIYEGNRSNTGQKSKNGCWQENRLFGTYKKELECVFDSVTSKYRMYICK